MRDICSLHRLASRANRDPNSAHPKQLRCALKEHFSVLPVRAAAVGSASMQGTAEVGTGMRR
jgi:hypothetical protein